MNPTKTIDARGLACPMPVLQTRQALDQMTCGELLVTVDEEVAKENITRLAHHFSLPIRCRADGREYHLSITKNA